MMLAELLLTLLALAPTFGPGDAVLERIEVQPRTWTLAGARSRLRPIVVGHFDDGRARDLTEAAVLVPDDPGVVAVVGDRLEPRADGVTTVQVKAAGHSQSLEITVVRADEPDPISFRWETLAVLTRQGCNAGSCHGSPKGKGGFSLSLFAFDPENDARVLTRDAYSRRTNVFDPEQSLVLKKPTLRISHVGGRRLVPDDVAYHVLRNWIAEGARRDPVGAPSLEGLRLEPGSRIVRALPDAAQRLRVVARFTDGVERDVTEIATYQSSDTSVATVDRSGRVQGVAAGAAGIMVRYLDALESVDVTIVRDVPEFSWTEPESGHPVDRHVKARLQLLQIPPAPLCDDATFLRRLHLDLTGLLPTVAETRAFLADSSSEKRPRAIDRLLAGEAHARYWARQRADLLRLRRDTLKDAAEPFADWLLASTRENRPFDEVTRELLTAEGAPAAYYLASPKVDAITETTTQLFMGSRLGCAKCHNHPYERWTQSDDCRISASFEADVKHPLTGEEMRPWASPGQGEVSVPQRRADFAARLTAAENPFFARVEVNRIWSQLFGRGIVEPVDDFRSSNPPSIPSLLDALAQERIDSGFDRRHLLRLITNSRTYQRAAEPSDGNRADRTLFSHQRARLLGAEQVHDAISRVTEEREFQERARRLAVLEQQRIPVLAQHRQQQPEWESALRERLSSLVVPALGAWFASTVFEDPNAFAKDFGPEATVWEAGALGWTERPEWVDGAVHALTLPAQAALYLTRTLQVDEPRRCAVSLGSDDGLRLWLNGTEVVAGDVARGVQPDQDRVELDLPAGESRLLLKIVNRGGASGFTFRLDADTVDGGLARLVRLAPTAPDSGTRLLARWQRARRVRLSRGHVLGSDHGRVAGSSGRQLAVAGGTPGESGQSLLVDLMDGSVSAPILRREDVILSVAFDPSGERVATAAVDGAVSVHRVDSAERVWEQRLHSSWANEVTIDRAGQWVASAGRDHVVKVFRATDGELFTTYAGHTQTLPDRPMYRHEIEAAVFAVDDSWVATAGEGGEIHAWDPVAFKAFDGTAAQMETRFKKKSPVDIVAIGTDRTLELAAGLDVLFAGGTDGVLRQVEPATGRVIRELGAGGDWIYAIAIHSESGRVAAGRYDGRVTIWQVTTGELVADFAAAPGRSLSSERR